MRIGPAFGRQPVQRVLTDGLEHRESRLLGPVEPADQRLLEEGREAGLCIGPKIGTATAVAPSRLKLPRKMPSRWNSARDGPSSSSSLQAMVARKVC